MDNKLLMQFSSLALFVLWTGFCFCDGFGLRTSRKLLWFGTFLAIAFYVLQTTNEFDLALILPVTSLLAILLCMYQKRESKKEK